MKFCPHCSAFHSDGATYCPEDGTALKRTHDPYLGRTIAARYQLIKRLGSGGMSNVYLAHHVMIERLSALKILRDDLSRRPVHRERFLREARAVNRINHPNIVEISDLGEADGVVYLVMEFVDGLSLHQEIGRGILPWPRAVRIALQVAAALARAHQMGVVHRDLKPENILLAKARRADDIDLTQSLPASHTEYDNVKLTDFGIAKILDEPSLTVGEQVLGTPGYIAPEYLRGQTTDPRSDLYSLGVILYEMTTGTFPYDERGAALMAAPMRELPVPPSRRVPGYFPELETLILHLLARSPDERPPDAFAVYDALVRLVRAETDSDAPRVSTTPSATRISYAAQHGVRANAQTMAETSGSVASALYIKQCADLAATASSGTLRWHEAFAELEAVLAARRRGDDSAAGVIHAAELLTLARAKLLRLETAGVAALAQQRLVDALDARGRTFRADIGSAIDQLVLERSRERAHRDGVGRHLEGPKGQPGDPRARDVQLWERVVLVAEQGSSQATLEDLSFQIDALQNSLFEKNAALEDELVEASGALEGSLAALRHLTHELQRLLDEARGSLFLHDERLPPDAQPVTQHSPSATR